MNIRRQHPLGKSSLGQYDIDEPPRIHSEPKGNLARPYDIAPTSENPESHPDDNVVTTAVDSPPPSRENPAGNGAVEEPNRRKAMSFFDHLEELRARIFRALLYILPGAIAAWFFYGDVENGILGLLVEPIHELCKQYQIPVLVFDSIFQPLMLKMQISIAGGLVLAFPLVLYEILTFIWPALYKPEKRFVILLLPFALLLFCSGIFLCYKIVPVMARFMLMFIPKTADTTQSGLPDVLVLNFGRIYVWFLVKIAAAMGLVFQMPLVMMFLAKLELITTRTLLAYWRHAIIGIFMLAAIITPTIDPFNLLLVAVPIVILYGLSIILVAWVNRKSGHDPA